MATIDDVVKQAKRARRKSAKRKNSPQSSEEIISDINYSTTKVINVDNETLTKNRVIAQNKEDPRSTPFHMLRTKVLRELRDNDWNSIAISAPTPGAGKSLVTVNLAMSIAMETNQTVLIVDMDLRKPSIHKYFSFEPEYGVQDYIENNASVEDVMINPGIERLVVMPGRMRTLNSAEQLASPKLKALTEELKNKYKSRVIIYDLPPLLVSDDVMVFLPNVDCSLLVVESGVNTKEEIESSIGMLDQKPLLGTVLNKEIEQKKIYVY
ncbi:CpsD/CapB family tyrosine-protein kinase [Amphritea sp. HPY]|uniref:CpsD/CapB family tyrosine-protein kinase n=1 Tax=Amphritea sp. HPY TaxID=3421652 RepID=UPI003D7D6B1E